MNQILIVYGSKYGSTKEIIETIAKGLENVEIITPDTFIKENYNAAEFVIIASGIYSEQFHPEIINFVTNNENWLKQKQIVLLGVCLGGQRGIGYLASLKEKFGNSVKWTGMAKGRLVLKKLTDKDFSLMKTFTDKVGMPLMDRDFVDPDEITSIAIQLRKIFKN